MFPRPSRRLEQLAPEIGREGWSGGVVQTQLDAVTALRSLRAVNDLGRAQGILGPAPHQIILTGHRIQANAIDHNLDPSVPERAPRWNHHRGDGTGLVEAYRLMNKQGTNRSI
jgi:hypothetical protein